MTGAGGKLTPNGSCFIQSLSCQGGIARTQGQDKKVGHPNFKLHALYMSCARLTELSSQGPLMALALASKHS